jgi:hypothetical protein
MIRAEIMINNNLIINLNPTVSLNSIHYKSNQHRESFPYELEKIHPKMLQRDGVVMKMMKVLVMMVMMMMILMKPSSMTMTMATISTLREGISPIDFYLPESFLSLCVFRPAGLACVAPWWLTLPSPSGYFRLPAKYEYLGIFLELLVFRIMVS